MTRNSGRIAAWTVGGLVIAAILVGVYVANYGLVSPIATTQRIELASQIDQQRLEIGFRCTHGEADIQLQEGSDRIAVRISARTQIGDCGSAAILTLGEALDDRPLVDMVTGEEIPVSGRLAP